MADSIEQFSYELTANALAEQERAAAALRTRAGTILAAASIAGSFLGTKASHGSFDGSAIAALITFALCLASAVWVLLPHQFVFAVRGETLLGETTTSASTMSPRRTGLPAFGWSLIWTAIASCSRGCPVGSRPVASCLPPRWCYGPSASQANLIFVATTPPKNPFKPKPPAQLPTEAPPGFALPEPRPSLFGARK